MSLGRRRSGSFRNTEQPTGSDFNLAMLALHTGITFFVSGQSQELSCGSDLFLSLSQIPTKNIEGQMTPYYPVELGNGTPCSLRQNLPRSSTVMYICHPEAKHEILSVAEVTTCEYEVVILTPLLCNHPKYRYSAHSLSDTGTVPTAPPKDRHSAHSPP